METTAGLVSSLPIIPGDFFTIFIHTHSRCISFLSHHLEAAKPGFLSGAKPGPLKLFCLCAHREKSGLEFIKEIKEPRTSPPKTDKAMDINTSFLLLIGTTLM